MKKVLIFGINLTAILSIIAGIVILIYPTLLNDVVAIYLIVFGIIGIIRSGRESRSEKGDKAPL